MATTAEAWLTREVQQHLEDYGLIGLYELPWLLRGSEFQLTDQQAIELSERVGRNVLAKECVELHRLRWPSAEIVEGPLPSALLGSDDIWGEGPGGTYIALVYTDNDSLR